VDAETDEHDLRPNLGLGTHGVAAHDEVFFPALHLLAVFLVEHDRSGRGVDAIGEHRHRLEPAAVLTAGLEPDRLELARHVVRRLVVLRRAGHAAFACIVGQVPQVGFDAFAVDDRQPLLDGLSFRWRRLGRGFGRRISAASRGEGDQGGDSHGAEHRIHCSYHAVVSARREAANGNSIIRKQ
jgi:hypothetical protein